MAALQLRPVIVFAVILHMLVGLAWGRLPARFGVQKNSIRITAPDSLQDSYDSAIGNFGIPQYPGTIKGIVVYEREFAKGCDPFPHWMGMPIQWGIRGRPPIFLVDRGNCFFALKVYHAQLAGAAAVLIADDRVEELIRMDSSEDSERGVEYVENITIPSALINKDLGDRMKKSVDASYRVHIELEWTESLPHPDDRVEYEFWTNSGDICGPKCAAQVDFVKNFKGAAQLLERGGYTLFTPHYITWYCPAQFIHRKECLSQCINHGRYCAPDAEPDFVPGYEGKDVVVENLRQLCVFHVSKKAKRPWAWWDYVTDLQIRCPTIDQKYSGVCAEAVIQSLSLSVEDVRKCMGDPTADSENPILKAEQYEQRGNGKRGDVTFLPTLMINNGQYRGKLDKGGVLKAICAGFKEETDPPPCLSEEVETNECLDNNGGCWKSTTGNVNVTACRDTFRGRVCECPVVQGVRFVGDGYQTCEPTGPGRCKFSNGGCWQETQGSTTFSGCSDGLLTGCRCPEGFEGDGTKQCVNIDECSMQLACQSPECTCHDTWGSYDCQCQGDLLYIKEHDKWFRKVSAASIVGWWISLVVIVGVMAIALVGYMVYKYRLQSYMDSGVRPMAQYMPLDSQAEMGQEHKTIP